MNNSRILIADDEPLNSKLFSEILKSSGATIISAPDGFEALNLALAEVPDLIILDWNMPRMDGLEALLEMKKHRLLKDVPVIMITGIMTTPENLRTALEAGAIDFLRKPFDRVELLARSRSMLLLSRSIKELNEKYQLIEGKNRFIQSIMESIPHPFVFYDLNGIINGCNSHFEELTGFSKQKIIDKIIYDYLNPATLINHRDHDRELIESKTDKTYESRFVLLERDYIFSKTLYYKSEKKPEGILCMLTDITDLKQAHDEIMENKKRELASSALRLIQLSEMNNNLISDLEKITEYTTKKGGELIRNTISKFNNNATGSVWKEFETRFENVYESFYERLNQLFPDLTPGEKKLCALLRLNLTSKDIAALTFQNPQSVDMARYRLRKKFNLEKDENLVDFLMNIK